MPWSEDSGISKDEYTKMVESDRGSGPSYIPKKRDIVTRPTRDLNERSGTYRPRHRDLVKEAKKQGTYRDDPGPNLKREPKRDWWNEPKRDYRPEKSAKERRLELLTGGGGGSSRDSDRYSLLTGRGLSSNEDRMEMLTGRSDPPKEEWKSQYGGRREYDPQDREFNRQFDTEPSDNRIVRSQFSSSNNALQNFGDTGSTKGWPVIDNVPTRRDQRENTLKGYEKGGDVEGMYDEFRGTKQSRPTTATDPWVLKNFGTTRDPDTLKESVIPGEHWWHRDDLDDWNRKVAQENNNPQVTPQKTSTGAETNAWGQKPLNAEEIAAFRKKQDSFATAQENYETRLKSLESRSPIVNQPTVDLSGVEGRIAQLEGKKPQDLSEIQGRLSELEGKGPSWQEDRVKQLEGSRSESKSARNLLDQRIASLENYYKNDPPPAESTGNRYEDKLANLNKMWERTGKAQSWGDAALAEPQKNKSNWDYSYSNDQGQHWAKDLPTGYVEGIRNLNREYNKPMHEAIIKGREYKAYDPRAAARLRYLDQENIHEDTYLGKGNWDDAYGEQVFGKGKGDKDRYFASQSGLEKDSDDYTKRFSDRWGNMGKDYAWYQ